MTRPITTNAISKMKFGEYGKKAPKGSRFNGTLNTASLVGWYEYTNRDDACDDSKQLMAKATNNRPDGFFGYTTTKKNDNDETETLKTFSNIGWIDSKNVKQFKNSVRESFSKNGDLFWMDVLSIRDYAAAEQYGMYDVNDYAAIVNKVLPQFFNYVHLDPNNMIWWMNYHKDTDNPHMHITFLEKEKTRTRGKFTKKEIGKYKALFIKEFGLRKQLKKEVGIDSELYFKNKDKDKGELIKHIQTTDFSKEGIDLNAFYKKLPSTGRLQYNSVHMAPYRKELNAIIDQILSTEEVKGYYQTWMKSVNQLAETMNDAAHENIATIKETELKKLYSNIGNMLLRGSKKQVKFSEAEAKVTDSNDTIIETEDINKSKEKNQNKKYKRKNIIRRIPVKNLNRSSIQNMSKRYLRQREEEIQREIDKYLQMQSIENY